MITVNKNNGLHLGGRPFLNSSRPHALIMGHMAGNNWSCGSSSQISFEWTRAGSHATGMQVCQQPAMFFSFTLTKEKTEFVFTSVLPRVSLLQCQAYMSGAEFMLCCTPKHLYHFTGYYICLFWAQWLFQGYDCTMTKLAIFNTEMFCWHAIKTIHAY